MPEHNSPNGWICCAICVLKPWQIARLSFKVSVTTAGLWGGTSLLWYTTTITLFAAALFPGPPGRQVHIFDGIWGALSTSLVISLFVLGIYIFLFLLPAMAMRRNRHLAVVFAHSILSLLLPYTA